MKKTVALIFAIIIAACFCVFAFAADEEAQRAEIKLLDSEEKTVGTYEFDPTAEGFDARNTFQRAIYKARSTASEENPLTVVIPKGEYIISSSINAYSFISLDFSGSVLTRKEGCNAAYLRFGSSSMVSHGYDGFKNITIKNAVFDDKKLEHNSSFLRFAHAQNIMLENVTMKNSVGVTHLLTFAASKNVTVKNCRFYNMDVSKINAYQNCEAIQIDILKEAYFSNYGAYDGTPTSDVTVTGCKFKNVPRGCGTHSAIAGYYFRNMVFTKNTFQNIPGYAIKTMNYRNSKITNNTILDCGSGICVSDITDTSLKNCYAPLSEETVLETESKMKISGNKISVCDTTYDSRAYAYGIEIFGAKIKKATDKEGKEYSGDFRMRNVSITNNTITSSVQKKNFHAIQISGAYSKSSAEKSTFIVSGNTLLYTAKRGSKQTVNMIRLQNSTNVLLKGNSTAKDCKRIGMFLLIEDSKGTVAAENSFSTGGVYAVLIRRSSGSTISKNTFSKTSDHAIYAYKKCSKTTVKGNAVSSSFGCAIAANACSGVTVNKNKVKKSKSTGIYTTGCTGVSVTSNTISACKNGIYIKDSSGKSISSNSVSKPKERGIRLNGKTSFSSVSRNYICSPGMTGIELIGKSAVTSISENRIDTTIKDICAISVGNSASVKKVNSNKINCKTDKASKKLKTTASTGILIRTTDAKLTQVDSNTVKDCKIGIRYAKLAKKGSVKNNKFSKCSTKIKVG